MFLRSNARRGGLEYRGQPYQGVYCGLFEDGEVARACADISGRTITGLAGPVTQVPVVRAALGREEAPTKVEGADWMYGLDLADLAVPDALVRGEVTCRPQIPEERATLCEWPDGLRHRAARGDRHAGRAASFGRVPRSADRGIQCLEVLLDPRGQLVSLCAFNATLPDMVLIGKFVDLHMLMMASGRERRQEEYGEVLSAAGFDVKRVRKLRSSSSVVVTRCPGITVSKSSCITRSSVRGHSFALPPPE